MFYLLPGCAPAKQIDFRSLMHPRNPYRHHRPDFAALAAQHPDLAPQYLSAADP